MESFSARGDSFRKAAMASGKSLEALNLTLLRKWSSSQAAFCAGALETAKQWTSNFAQHQALPDLFDAQRKLLVDYNARCLTAARENTDLLLATREDYQSWFEQGYQFFTAQAQDVTVKPVASRKGV